MSDEKKTRGSLGLVMVALLIGFLLIGCASVPKEFDPTETPFEGEWKGFNSYNQNILTYTFTGNRWEFTWRNINNDEDDYSSTGLFRYNEKRTLYSNEKGKGTQGFILFSNEKGNWSQEYELRGSYRFYIPLTGRRGSIQASYGYFTKQPYGDLVISYITKEKSFSDIVSNEEELASIQGSWRSYNKQATYTFSGDQFTRNVLLDYKPVTGTIKIKDNLLYLIVSDEQFGIFYIDFLPDNRIFLIDLWGHKDLWWGEFIKQ